MATDRRPGIGRTSTIHPRHIVPSSGRRCAGDVRLGQVVGCSRVSQLCFLILAGQGREGNAPTGALWVVSGVRALAE
ncbi:MAG: hypothetical protein SPJ97_03600 [Bacteroides sp.]|nr:hypothetical protein [Bacteroides sp.]